MRSKEWNALLAGLMIAPIPWVAHAETYLSENQAASILFPGVRLESRGMNLKGLQAPVRILWGPNNEALIIDRVLGKHEYITYAVAIDSLGKVQGIEIMDYRETYGGQIRGAEWRKQFVGKSLSDPVKLGTDIQNISGATLSSKHITEGVRRVLQTYEILKTKG